MSSCQCVSRGYLDGISNLARPAFPIAPSPSWKKEQIYWISELRLTDFRNHSDLSLSLSSRPVVLVGKNGAGKTNLLEAISLLLPGRGLRGAAMSELKCETGRGSWTVWAKIEGPEGTQSVGTGQISGMDHSRREARVNGCASVPLHKLARLCRMVWLTPSMDGLFMGAAMERRQFLDRLVLALNPEHKQYVMAFDKSMRQRNNLLEQGRYDPAWLGVIEAQMAEYGTAIAAARCETIALLQDILSARHSKTPFPVAYLQLDGCLESDLAGRPAIDVEDRYRLRLKENRPTDARAKRTLEGPHRSDLAVYHANKKHLARLCSTGEQKILLISLVLSHARLIAIQKRGAAPLVLFDEVAAHLDIVHRTTLFEELHEIGVQAWMTGIEKESFTSFDAQIYRLTEGRLENLE
ncbi:MAG: DNA replication/repair protein RecF [Alphaproteobacteria bacterium]|nr:DNA replication/repair protein RecF [Alphaproteobacteria bacterium]